MSSERDTTLGESLRKLPLELRQKIIMEAVPHDFDSAFNLADQETQEYFDKIAASSEEAAAAVPYVMREWNAARLAHLIEHAERWFQPGRIRNRHRKADLTPVFEDWMKCAKYYFNIYKESEHKTMLTEVLKAHNYMTMQLINKVRLAGCEPGGLCSLRPFRIQMYHLTTRPNIYEYVFVRTPV